MKNRCYLISTTTDGHLLCSYATDKLMTLNEALETLADILDIDPNAKLVRIAAIEKIDRRALKKYMGKTA